MTVDQMGFQAAAAARMGGAPDQAGGSTSPVSANGDGKIPPSDFEKLQQKLKDLLATTGSSPGGPAPAAQEQDNDAVSVRSEPVVRLWEGGSEAYNAAVRARQEAAAERFGLGDDVLRTWLNDPVLKSADGPERIIDEEGVVRVRVELESGRIRYQPDSTNYGEYRGSFNPYAGDWALNHAPHDPDMTPEKIAAVLDNQEYLRERYSRVWSKPQTPGAMYAAALAEYGVTPWEDASRLPTMLAGTNDVKSTT